MNTKKIISHNVAAIAVVLSFVFSIPVFSGGPVSGHGYGRPSAEFRPVFVQLVGQAAESRASLAYNASEYGMNNMDRSTFAEIRSNLERSAQEIEKALAYEAPTSDGTMAKEEATGTVLSNLLDVASQMEGTLVYTAPEFTI